MGMDKEATDIWKFGRSRLDLSPLESLNAPEPKIGKREAARRKRLLAARLERQIAAMKERMKDEDGPLKGMWIEL